MVQRHDGASQWPQPLAVRSPRVPAFALSRILLVLRFCSTLGGGLPIGVRELVRPRHPDKHLEALLKEAELRGWRVEKGKKYYKMYCPAPCGQHLKTVKLTPSNPNYERECRNQLARATCWDEQEGV